MEQFHELPKKWKKEINGMSSEDASLDLSTHRTEMSHHRTALSDARSHMANERTHLAYLRTSMALMSFGITLNRFSIYLQENKPTPPKHLLLFQTEVVGLGMVLVGMAILIWALIRYRKVNLQLLNDSYTIPERSISLLTLAILLIGGMTSAWLFLNRI